ncbi:type II toxin-antitoxin system Phd/YefM family antitoxin [Leifsonia sp. ZF2019]|uniref:type II toxin-antitoxin system Phd/YefM family antitoxin n=1 Tax=Leifsonia sp. ZF2019 TaxID=2781978 RepID=UPI001CC05CD3|nr:type II toxin-antitoxin system Phd/YefM family antitoxin [Leifsonia sp. ZF2019]UAJ80756.1 type II toxin-antitoxin system Phd/YefM family antitoxin [Leifsonia sp. ZF2019]
MQTLPISAVKARLSELVDSASHTREEVAITVNGSPAAMLIGIDEWEELQERLHWLSTGDDLVARLAEARREVESGGGLGEDEIRARFGVPRR